VLVIQFVGDRNKDFVKTVVSGFVSTDEDDGSTPWIEGVKQAQRTPLMLDS